VKFWKLIAAPILALCGVGPTFPVQAFSCEYLPVTLSVWNISQFEEKIGSHFTRKLGLICDPPAQIRLFGRDIEGANWKGEFTVGPRFDVRELSADAIPIEILWERGVLQNSPIYSSNFDWGFSQNLDTKINLGRIGSVFHPKSTMSKPRPPLLVSDERISLTARFISRAPGFAESRVNKRDADHAYNHTTDRGDTHDAGPERGTLLRHKVIIFAALIVALQLMFGLCVRSAISLLGAGQDIAGLVGLLGGVAGIFGSSIVGYLLISNLL
jgi:hypothetical protein